MAKLKCGLIQMGLKGDTTMEPGQIRDLMLQAHHPMIWPGCTVDIACQADMPCAINPEANMYEGTQTAIPTHRAVMFTQVQVRCDSEVGARSGFHSWELSWPLSSKGALLAVLLSVIVVDASVS